jgi:hypothetical protein
MRRFIASLAFCCLACVCAAPAWADPPPEMHKEAHTGFFLRLNAGLGYMSTSETNGPSVTTTTGIAGMGELGVGWAVIPNLILHLDVASVGAIGPKVAVNGLGATAAGSGSAADTVANFGVGATYYLMPFNFWLGGAVGGSAAWLDYGAGRLTTSLGWGFVLNVGKEVWVSENWGLGFSGQFLFSAVPESATAATHNLNTAAFGIMACGTFN